MAATFGYENSEQHGLKVNRLDASETTDRIKRAIKKGDRLTTPEAISDGDGFVEVENGNVKISSSNEPSISVESGLTEVFGDLKVHGDVQRLGKRIEVWQNVVKTGDNLIELNDNLKSTKVPYSGIEVNRGEEESAFLVYREATGRFESALGGESRPFALFGDPLTSFEMDITTDHVEEGEENKYSRPIKTTHNFWVSDEVATTVGEERQILPAFVSIGEQEKKFVTKVRGKLSGGSASVVLLLNENQKGEPIEISKYKESEMELPLKDGDRIGIGITETTDARNLSVSVEVTRYVN